MATEPDQLPSISIIVPSYNQGAYIGETLQSVVDQGYPNLELIVMDGGSTDQSVEVISSFSDHISYWESQPDRGQSHAINKGLQRCTGQVVNWLNSDDLLAPGALWQVGRAFVDDTTNVLGGGLRFIENDTLTDRTQFNDWTQWSLPVLLSRGVILQPATFWRRSAWQAVGLHVEERLHYAMDWNLLVRYLAHFGKDGMTLLPEVLAHFRYHEASKSTTEAASAAEINQFDTDSMATLHALAQHYHLAEADAFQAFISNELPEIAVYGSISKEKVRSALHEFFLWMTQLKAYARRDRTWTKKCFGTVRMGQLSRKSLKPYVRIWLWLRLGI